MKIHTSRLSISEFTNDIAESVHLNSLDSDNRRFVPDEVFESIEAAHNAISFLKTCYKQPSGPFVYAVFASGIHIGHVQVAQIEYGWEVGYHIGQPFTRMGYATEALLAFIPEIMKKLKTTALFGICDPDNYASQRVLEKCGFKLIESGFKRKSKETDLVYLFE